MSSRHESVFRHDGTGQRHFTTQHGSGSAAEGRTWNQTILILKIEMSNYVRQIKSKRNVRI